MLQGKTLRGFEFNIEEKYVDNWEFVERVSELKDNDMTALVGLVKEMLGEKQYESLKEFNRNDDGIIPATIMYQEISSIFDQNELKKVESLPQ